MKIGIIGAGAMGCLFGGKLSETGNEVWLLDIDLAHISRINESGLDIKTQEKITNYKKLHATTNPNEVGIVDIAIIFVKSTHTYSALKQNIAIFSKDTMILTLQNGLGNIQEIEKLIVRGNIIAGTTAHGATMLGNGFIRHAGNGKSIIGFLEAQKTEDSSNENRIDFVEEEKTINSNWELINNNLAKIAEVKKILIDAGFDTTISENIQGTIWDKLIVNVGINALTAILEIENGKIPDSPYLTEILRNAINEAAKIANKIGVTLEFDDPVEHALEVCRATSKNRSSMLQDIDNKRSTEIKMINGAIVKEGIIYNVSTPVNELLTKLIMYKESNYGRQG